ncbi:hypothetical protein TrispH2_011807 [Trichoplax sp. H2]|nr:hypothetical protein TrispH2_011807 [Trichoplax sp. H2]|eukprot:RDD36083.1 hypothetical protein TrispH2_011807 [Trichoplax sp. H2]
MFNYSILATLIVIGNESNVIPIGLHYGITNELQIYENKIYWIGGAVPADTVKVEVRIIGVSQHVFITVNILAIAAIILAIVFLSLNIMKRKRK